MHDLKNMVGRVAEKFKDVPLPSTVKELYENMEKGLSNLGEKSKFDIKAIYVDESKKD